MTLPRISVLMPVYNGASYLQEALNSILEQSYSDFELIALYDVSSDSSLEILHACQDSRLVVFENDQKQGLSAILNKGLAMAKGEFIARMDCDDVSHPERFARQIAFLDDNPNIGICGTWYRGIDPSGRLRGRAERLPISPGAVHAYTFFQCVMGHPTVMMRSSILRDYGLEYDATEHSEDFELWARALNHCQIANIPEFLLFYRKHPTQVSGFHDKLWDSTKRTRAKMLAALGIQADEAELELHQQICSSQFIPSITFIHQADHWLCRIKAANDQCRLYPEPHFSRALIGRWSVILSHSLQSLGFQPRLYLRSNIMVRTGLGVGYLAKYYSKIFLTRSLDRIYNHVTRIRG